MEAAKRWGAFTIDGFASNTNKQCSKYVDTVDLNFEKAWLNPPFKLIGPTLGYLHRNNWEAVIVIPYWPEAEWFDIWRSMLQDADRDS